MKLTMASMIYYELEPFQTNGFKLRLPVLGKRALGDSPHQSPGASGPRPSNFKGGPRPSTFKVVLDPQLLRFLDPQQKWSSTLNFYQACSASPAILSAHLFMHSLEQEGPTPKPQTLHP